MKKLADAVNRLRVASDRDHTDMYFGNASPIKSSDIHVLLDALTVPIQDNLSRILMEMWPNEFGKHEWIGLGRSGKHGGEWVILKDRAAWDEWYHKAMGTSPLIHSVNCEKKSHTRDGYLHAENDDTSYDVDGCQYCGRCHLAL